MQHQITGNMVNKIFNYIIIKLTLQTLKDCLPEVDFSQSSLSSTLSLGEYIVKHLQETWKIIQSSPHIENDIVVVFANQSMTDANLPLTLEIIIGASPPHQRFTNFFADTLISVQSAYYSVSFEQAEFKKLKILDKVSFSCDGNVIGRGSFGVVYQVTEPSGEVRAKKVINNNVVIGMEEIRLLTTVSNIKNEHLLKLRCAYSIGEDINIIVTPFCQMTLQSFLKQDTKIITTPFWNELRSNSEKIKLSLIG